MHQPQSPLMPLLNQPLFLSLVKSTVLNFSSLVLCLLEFHVNETIRLPMLFSKCPFMLHNIFEVYLYLCTFSLLSTILFYEYVALGLSILLS